MKSERTGSVLTDWVGLRYIQTALIVITGQLAVIMILLAIIAFRT
jgi:hypothetical protein